MNKKWEIVVKNVANVFKKWNEMLKSVGNVIDKWKIVETGKRETDKPATGFLRRYRS